MPASEKAAQEWHPARSGALLCVMGALWLTAWLAYPALWANLLPLTCLWGWRYRISPAAFLPLAALPYLMREGLSVPFMAVALVFLAITGKPAIDHITERLRNYPQKPAKAVWWVLTAGIGFALTVLATTLTLHRNFETGIWDLGVYDNVFANIIAGNGQTCPAERCNPETNHLDIHKSWIYFALAQIYRLAPRAETLLAFNAFAVPITAVTLFLLAKERLKDQWQAAAVGGIWIFYTPAQGAVFFQFHENSFAPMFLFLCGWTLLRGHRYLPWVALGGLLSIKEEYAIIWAPAVICFGIWSNRPKTGWALAGACALYFAACETLLHGPNTENFGTLFGNIGTVSTVGIAELGLRNPVRLIADGLWAEKNLLGFLAILTPLAFLPAGTLMGWAILALPCILHYLPGNQTLANNSHQYSLSIAAPAFVAMLHALGRMGRHKRTGWVMLAVALCAATQLASGPLNPQNSILAGGNRFRVPHKETDKEERYKELRTLLKSVPKNARVMASNTIMPHISSRPIAYAFEPCLMERGGYYQGNVKNKTLETLPSWAGPEIIILWRGSPDREKIPPWFLPDETSKSFETWRLDKPHEECAK